MIKEMLYLLILILGLPSGLILAKLCKEEIKSWKKELMIINIASIIALTVIFIDFHYKIPVIITLLFIIIMNMTILWKSYR